VLTGLFIVTTTIRTREKRLTGSAIGGEDQEGRTLGPAAEHALLTLGSILADIARESVASERTAGAPDMERKALAAVQGEVA
jgi:hypothetical protein